MKKLVAFLGVATLVLAAGCGGTSSGKVLVDINGKKITEGDLKFLGEINPRIEAQINNPIGQKRILENLVEQDLLYQQAVKEGVNRDPKVKAKIDLYHHVIIAQSLLDAEAEKVAKKYYDEHQDEAKKLKLSHIMVKFATPEEIKKAKKDQKLLTEAEALKKALEVKARIDGGDEFAKVAQEMSDDFSTKSRGGDMGLASKGDKRFEGRGFGPLIEKAFEMKVGEVSGPIKTDKGYHIVTVTRGVELEPYNETKEAILLKVRNDSRTELLARLKKEAKIVYPEEEKAKETAKKETAKKEAEAKKGAETQKEGAEVKAGAEGETAKAKETAEKTEKETEITVERKSEEKKTPEEQKKP